MNIQLLSKQLLEEALTQGTITLQNGSIKQLKATEILSVAKFIVTNSLTTEDKATPQVSMPSEMFGVTTTESNSPKKEWPECGCETICEQCGL